MSSQYHPFFVVTDDLDHPTVKTIFASARLNNLAVEAQQNGLFEDAVDLHRQALAMKLTVRDPESVEVAISYEGLGVALRLSGKVLEAREYHEKALYIREDGEFGGLGKGIREDAACTRDSLACILEFEGRMKEAREMRLRGEAKDEMLCANFHECTKTGCLPRSELRACLGCHAAFYHSVHCQKIDWIQRHKPYCKAYQAKVKGKAPAKA